MADRMLNTIQKRYKLNDVYACGEDGPGGARHDYVVMKSGSYGKVPRIVGTIQFQKGPRDAEGSVDGVLDVDLLEIVRDRLTAFQKGDMGSRDNACALHHIEEALMWMNKRVEDRAERKVLGTMEK